MNGKTLDYLIRILVALLTAAILWASSTIITLREDIAVMKGNRFTSQDGLEVRADMIRLEARLFDEINHLPPTEWRARIIAIEECLQRIQQNRDCD